MLFLFIWIIVESMLMAILKVVITLYNCEMIFNLYIVSFLVLNLFRSVCYYFQSIAVYVVGIFVAAFTRTDLSTCLWNDHYCISRSLIDSLLALIYMVFYFIWIIVARMCVAVLQEVITLYDFEMIIFLYPVLWMILFLLRSESCFLSFALL